MLSVSLVLAAANFAFADEMKDTTKKSKMAKKVPKNKKKTTVNKQ